MSIQGQFLNLLFGRFNNYLGLIEIRAIAPDWRPTHKRVLRFFTSTVDEAIAKINELNNQEPYNIYFGVLPRHERSSGREALRAAAALWVDIDEKHVGSKQAAMDKLRQSADSVGAEPSIVVDSGNGLHGYWLLDRIVRQDIPAIERANLHLASLCGGDKTHDGPRVLRVPYSVNWKIQDRPSICHVLSLTNQAYPLELFLPTVLSTDPPQRGRTISTSPDAVPVAVSLSDISPLWRRYIVDGLAADARGFYKGDKSALDFAVTMELIKKGFDDQQIADILTNPAYAISIKSLSKQGSARTAYLQKTLDKAHKYLGD